MPKFSAGILLVRRSGATSVPEVLLVHPGGPFWANKDDHAWSIPKGEFDPDTEDALACARREFAEELGHEVPAGEPQPLGTFKQNSSKTIVVWWLEADLDVTTFTSNHFEMEWPPKSGTIQSFPEVDRVEWCPLDIATRKIHKGQRPLLEMLSSALDRST